MAVVAVVAAATDCADEDHPSDEEEDVHDPDVAIKIATALKEIGVKLYKDKDYVRSVAKYRKALKYLDQHPILAPESDVSYARKFAECVIIIAGRLTLAGSS